VTKAASSQAIARVQRFFPNVRVVRDAETSVQIEVTDRDTKVPGRGDFKNCAIAVACKRSMHLDGAIVARSTMYTVKGNVATRYKVPERAAREIVAFDRGGKFAAGVYELQPFVGASLLGKGRRGGQKWKHGAGRKIQHRHFTTGIRSVLGAFEKS